MKLTTPAVLLLVAAWMLSGCFGSETGYHRIKVAWAPGYENVPDCNPLIKMNGNSVDIKGVNVTTPAGVGVGGGEISVDPKTLQNASDAAIQADQKYVRLCRMLPSYSGDQKAFYKTRDQMFELIAATNSVAAQVATQTSQAPPAKPETIPTAATTAATNAGVDPAKAVANAPASAAKPAASPVQHTAASRKSGKTKLKDAVSRLDSLVKKKAPAPANQ